MRRRLFYGATVACVIAGLFLHLSDFIVECWQVWPWCLLQ
jgi:hypothetical protein